VAVSSLSLFFLALQGGQFLISSLALTLTGATLGFLVWNRPPARIYMGDSGSLFLGLLIASLTVRLEPNPINRLASFSVPILLMAVPILDTSVAVISRVMNRVSPFQGGRDHLSHRLLNFGLSRRKSVTIIWIICVGYNILSLILSNSPYCLEGYIASLSLLLMLVQFSWFIRH